MFTLKSFPIFILLGPTTGVSINEGTGNTLGDYGRKGPRRTRRQSMNNPYLTTIKFQKRGLLCWGICIFVWFGNKTMHKRTQIIHKQLKKPKRWSDSPHGRKSHHFSFCCRYHKGSFWHYTWTWEFKHRWANQLERIFHRKISTSKLSFMVLLSRKLFLECLTFLNA